MRLKKTCILLILVILIFGMVGCGSSNDEVVEEQPVITDKENEKKLSMLGMDSNLEQFIEDFNLLQSTTGNRLLIKNEGESDKYLEYQLSELVSIEIGTNEENKIGNIKLIGNIKDTSEFSSVMGTIIVLTEKQNSEEIFDGLSQNDFFEKGGIRYLLDFQNDAVFEVNRYGEEAGNQKIEDREINRKSELEKAIRNRINDGDYTYTKLDRITINENLGTDIPDDYIVLVYFIFDIKNTRNTGNNLMRMYSDDLVATLANKGITDISEAAIFWEDQYNSRSVKYAYEFRNDGFFIMDIAGE